MEGILREPGMNVYTFFWCTLPMGGLLVVAGFVILIYVIPKAGRRNRDSDSRTEFYSVRAAYYCVLAGLFVLVAFATGLAVRYTANTWLGGK